MADWWERAEDGRRIHRQIKRKRKEDAEEAAREQREKWQTEEEIRRNEERIERAAAKRGDNVVLLAALGAGEKAACVAAVELLRASGAEASDLVEAAEEWIRRHCAGGGLTVAELVERHVEWVKAHRRKATADDRRKQLRTLAETFGTSKVHQIGTVELREWVQGGGSPSVCAARKRAVSAMYGWAIGCGLAEENPAARIGVDEAGERGEVAVFTAEEAKKILQAAEQVAKKMVPYYAIGLFAGLRPQNELRGVQEGDVDMERGQILVRRHTSKTHRGRFVPMTETLRRWLEVYPVRGKVWWNKRAHRRVVKKAGIRWIQDGMRHSRASYRLAAGVPVATVAEEDGHSVATLNANYATRIIPREEAERFWGILPGEMGA